ncbi:hypothetical protein BJ170DRAFT_597981 [Xylariales sp. AK1849]|nr:hypothetical protein BJ170DRAFT_597981 [Xylariales sp. AK1849]
MTMPLVKFTFISTLLGTTWANTRMPDPGPAADILCTVEVVKMIRESPIEDNTLLLWPAGTCCTTTDCELQHWSCQANPVHPGKNGDVCCFKASGSGADIGYCRCGIDSNPQGTCY